MCVQCSDETGEQSPRFRRTPSAHAFAHHRSGGHGNAAARTLKGGVGDTLAIEPQKDRQLVTAQGGVLPLA